MRVDGLMNLPMIALLMLAGSAMAQAVKPDAYDPLKVAGVEVLSKTFVVHDAKRTRDLPLRVYLPASPKPAPVILFSHGLGGSCDNNPYLGNHWAKRGYLVVFVQHPGSDENVWMDAPVLQRMSAMKKAASFDNFLARTGDIPAVIDALTKWNMEEAHPLKGRLDPARLGMSGHSFGANTTQAVSGQSYAGQRVSFVEPRIDASVMMSPGPPAIGDPAAAFSSIRIPCLLMTGTRDDSPIGNMTATDRLKVFPHLQKAAAWQVVFDEATHMAFGERDLKGNAPREPRYHRAILALSTAFWDAELRGDRNAKAWLRGKGAKSVLGPKDEWMMNQRAAE
jgi:predicted dienelactone hydrolase